MLGIIDYGMGNLYSLRKALERLEVRCQIVSDADRLADCHGLILPGVGAFGDAMKNIRQAGLDQALKEYTENGGPLLGICLGMQLLFDHSEEHGSHQGLGLLPGNVIRFSGDYKIPHMGWNQLLLKTDDHPLLNGVKNGDYVYFVHSYHVKPANPANLLAVTDYHQEVTAVVGGGQVFGTQFHPEKSGQAGMRMLANFVRLCEGVLT
ncbi:MAG: imidazole glycerol phosphate synthase subunit HisH [Brevibacillus sp.]|nr:imidazole glycerol phosphate synthase subunit HisH [Brevibacillus sp.]